MKGKHFATIEEIKERSKQELLAIPKSAFQKCFEYWKKRWHKCIISEGGYFEENKIVVDNKQILFEKKKKIEHNGYFLITSCKPRENIVHSTLLYMFLPL